MNQTPFCFRGNRDYVLVADIFDSVLARLYGDISARNFDYVVKHPCRCQDFLLLGKNAATPANVMMALAFFQDSNHDLVIMPHGPTVEERLPCNEADVISALILENNNGKPSVLASALPQNFSLTRLLVVAFKHLLNSKVVASPQRYLFTRLRLETSAMTDFTIRFERKFAGQFYEGMILQEERPVGSIYFNGGLQ